MQYQSFSGEDLRKIYDNAKEFLIEKISTENAAEILEHYLNLPNKSKNPIPLNELYFRLLSSAQNANMKAGVIGGSMKNGVEDLGKVLFGFQPKEIKKHYQSAEQIFNEIVRVVQPRGKVRQEKNSIWVRYSRTILSASWFFSQFENGEEFYDWANHFYDDKKAMAALPYLLSEEIYGIGYPLACDFLKELGFINYGKPDVHIRKIFSDLDLCEDNASNATLQKIISNIAAAKEISAYNVDKLFWLIGSGYFYDHKHLGKDGKIGQQKDQFLEKFSSKKND